MVHIPADLPVSVVFARTLDLGRGAQIARPTVVIAPAPHNSWNNFGHNFDVNARLFLSDGKEVPLDVSIMFADGGRTSTRVQTILEDGPGWREGTTIDTPFCSLLQTADSYSVLVQLVGFELAVSALRQIGDAVVVSLECKDVTRLPLISSEPFLVSMLRRNEAYTALRRGGRYLRPTPAPIVEDAAVSFGMGVRLPSAPNAYLIGFDFSPDPIGRDRLSVLIGRNGTGKSQLLLSLIDGLRKSAEAPLSARIGPVHFAPKAVKKGTRAPEVSRVLVFSSAASDAYPIAIPPWHGVDYAFFPMTRRRDSAHDALTLSLVDCLRDDRRNTFPISQTSVDSNDETDRIGLLKRKLIDLRVWERLHIPLIHDDNLKLGSIITINDRCYFPIAQFASLNEQRQLIAAGRIDIGEEPLVIDHAMKPCHLSSGEAAMLRFVAQAVAAVETGALLLFDEPETHLHPSFISDFAEILYSILEATNSIALIATHSAYLVRETPSKRVKVLNFDDDGRIVISRPRMQTFGSSIDSISAAVFFDGSKVHRYQQTLSKWLKEQGDVTMKDVMEQHGAELNPESLSYIAQIIRSNEI
jgi:ABC-type branched-subunit amino acid transport system ATPase component